MVVEHFCKDAQYGGLILIDWTFDVDIEQDRLCRNTDALLHRRIHHWIIELVCEIVKGVFAIHLLVGKKVRKHFQEVRFTTSKEARDPNADLIRWVVNCFNIVIKEGSKVTP